jgi:exosortase F-associated protein
MNRRVIYFFISITVLVVLYLFQRVNYANLFFADLGANTEFIINKTIRFTFNDFAVILLIYSIFDNKGLLKIAFIIQCIEMLLILPLYFYFKLSIEGATELSSPLLSFIHRIVVNPIIMLLLIPAFWFQKTQFSKKS